MVEWNRIYCQDALEGFEAIEDNSVDCVLLDPPYNIGVDFGNNRYKQEINDYAEWCGQWIEQSERVLKDTGTMYIYGFSEILAHLSVNMNLEHRWLIWHYTNKTVPSSNFWQRSHESILCAWKDKSKRIFNREDVREPYTEKFIQGYKDKGRKRPASKGRLGDSDETVYTVNEKGALPRDVLKVSTLAGGAGMTRRIGWCRDCDKTFFGKESKEHKGHNTFKHPTQKPFELTKRLIAAVRPTDGRGKVLIPFAGSGSECIIAKVLDCDYLGFDLNKEYVTMAEEFIERYHTTLEEYK
jgi:site-specific DNA-methyltransferase (adenine-specific)